MTRRSLFRRVEELERCAPSALVVCALSDQEAAAEYAVLCEQCAREARADWAKGDSMSVQDAYECYSSMIQVDPESQQRKPRQSR